MRETKEKAQRNAEEEIPNVRFHRVFSSQPSVSKKLQNQHRLVAALEHHLSEWQRLGANELVRQYLLEEEQQQTKEKKKSRFRRASAAVLEVAALPPPTPPLVSSRPEPYLLTLHIPLLRSSNVTSLTAAGVAEGDIPPGLGPHVSWGKGEEEKEENKSSSSSFAHRACVWFCAGGPLVTLSPATYSRRVLDTDQEAITLVSALAVASGASNCPWPSCVPAGDGRRDGWLGVGPRGRGFVESEASRRLAARAQGPPRRLATPAGAAALLAARAAPRAPRAAEALRVALEPDAGIAAAALAVEAAPSSSSAALSSPRWPPPVRHVVEVDARATYRVPSPPLGASEAEKSGRGAAATAASSAGERGWDDGAPWRPWLLFPRCYPDPCGGGIEVDACWNAVPGRDAFGLNDEEEEEDDDELYSGESDEEEDVDGARGGGGERGVRASSVWRVYALSPLASSSSPADEAAAGGGRSGGAGGADAPAAAAAAAAAEAPGDFCRAAPLRLLPAALSLRPSLPLPPPPRPPTGGLASLVARLATSFTIAASARSMRDLESDRWWDARGTDAQNPVWPLPRAPAVEAVAAACADVLDCASDDSSLLALLPEGVLAAARRGEQGAAAAVAALRRFVPPPPLLSSSPPSSRLPSLLPRLAPAGSLASRLALRAAALAAATGSSSSGSSSSSSSNSTGDARVVASLWSSVVRELRFSHWERGQRLPRSSSSKSKERRKGKKTDDNNKPCLPDWGSSLLHQKLQMIDCCITARSAAAERRARTAAEAAAKAAGAGEAPPRAEEAAAQRAPWLPWPLARALETLAPSSSAPLPASAAAAAEEANDDEEMLDAEEGPAEGEDERTKNEGDGTDGDEASWASAASSSAWETSPSSSSSDGGDGGDDGEEGEDEGPREGSEEDVGMEDASSAPLRRPRGAAARASAAAARASPRGPRPPRGARGVLRVIPGARSRGRLPLCEPRLQRRPPETSDAAAARLSAARALHERAVSSPSPSPPASAADVLACPLVASDMAAFRAANPRGGRAPEISLEEFLGWRPPRGPPPPWAPTSGSENSGRNSKIEVEAWRGVWEASPPCPASQQRPLFDPEAEGERALHWLETLPRRRPGGSLSP